MKRMLSLILLLAVLLSACNGAGKTETPAAAGLPADAAALAAERGLTPDNIYAALKTYMPSGQTDPYIMFSSGGQSGQVLVIGVPSMRILKMIGVFTPESWQGYGFGGSSMDVLAGGNVDGNPVLWGDTHHPALSETGGEYDGGFLFIPVVGGNDTRKGSQSVQFQAGVKVVPSWWQISWMALRPEAAARVTVPPGSTHWPAM